MIVCIGTDLTNVLTVNRFPAQSSSLYSTQSTSAELESIPWSKKAEIGLFSLSVRPTLLKNIEQEDFEYYSLFAVNFFYRKLSPFHPQLVLFL